MTVSGIQRMEYHAEIPLQKSRCDDHPRVTFAGKHLTLVATCFNGLGCLYPVTGWQRSCCGLSR